MALTFKFIIYSTFSIFKFLRNMFILETLKVLGLKMSLKVCMYVCNGWVDDSTELMAASIIESWPTVPQYLIQVLLL